MSGAVFVGRVEKLESIQSGIAYEIKVEKLYAGKAAPIVKAYYYQASFCSLNIFNKGEQYLIYAKSNDGRQVEIFFPELCGRIFPLESVPKEDWDFIENIRPKMMGSKLHGLIWEDGGKMQPGIDIKIEGKDRFYDLKTDQNGHFEIDDLEPGEYLIRLLLPKNKGAFTGNDRKTFVYERGCLEENFFIQSK